MANDLEREDASTTSPSARRLVKDSWRDSFSSASSITRTGGGTGSKLHPRLQQMKKWISNHSNKRKALFWAAVATGNLQLAVKIVSLSLFCVLKDINVKKPAWIVFTSINILLLTMSLLIVEGRRLYMTRRQSQFKKAKASSNPGHEDREKLLKPANDSIEISEKEITGLWGRIGFLFNMFSGSFIVIASIVFLANSSSHILTAPSYSTNAAVEIGFEATDCALAVVFLIFDVLYECLSFAMVAQALSVVISVIHLLVSILCIWSNQGSRILNNLFDYASEGEEGIVYQLIYDVKSFAYFGIILAFTSGVGFVSGFSLDATNRLSDLGSTVSLTYIVTSCIAFVISAVYFGLSCYIVKIFAGNAAVIRDVLLANVLISVASMVLSICGIAAMAKVRQRPKTYLKVEEYDLSQLSEGQLEVWARLIDVYNKQENSNPDTAAGHEAISLLRAYAGKPMQNLSCRVLRIYDAGAKAYEKTRAWERLDNNEAFEDDASVSLPKESLLQEHTEDKAMSKNAAKRAKLKAQKKAKKKGGSDPANTVNEQLQQSPEAIKQDLKLRQHLIETEALVLLSTIEDYDLLSSVSNTWYGRLAAKLIGAQSPLKWTCVRMGLLATHWPFRQAMLFTAHTRKPNARTAAICRAIAEYNRKLPRSKRCSLILNPTVAHRGMEQALGPSGWAAVPLPPSHVVDLRPYKGNTLQDYLKKIKYRDQSKNFTRAHGEVIETKDFNKENCSTAIDLWWNIAGKRTADGNTSVLVNPTAAFLERLGTVNNDKGYRTLLFLKVDGKVIASAVLFRLGDTITSDLQGLDHDLARQYNAYFVMMQETISIALKSGLKFVDFGPTTSQPKMAIGCKEVGLFGGIYARPPLSWTVTIFSGSVHVDE